MIILIASQKGGCGKSTVAVNICSWLVNQKKDIVLVDSDRQSTASNWANDRTEKNNKTPVNCIQKYDNIKNALSDLDKRYDVVIVDAAGRDSREMRSGMLVADMLIVPFRCSQPDLDTLPLMKELIDTALDINGRLKVYGLLTIAPTNPIISEIDEAKECLRDYPELTLLDSIVCDRKIYRDAMSFGLGVIELDNPKAKAEINELCEEIFEKNFKNASHNLNLIKEEL